MNHITVKHIIFINFETFSRSCQCHETVGAAGYHTENANYYIHIFAKFHFWFLESQASVRASVQRYITTSECRSSTLIISRTNYLFLTPLYASTFPFCPFFALTFGRNHFFLSFSKSTSKRKGRPRWNSRTRCQLIEDIIIIIIFQSSRKIISSKVLTWAKFATWNFVHIIISISLMPPLLFFMCFCDQFFPM